jgi:hypothetical protein
MRWHDALIITRCHFTHPAGSWGWGWGGIDLECFLGTRELKETVCHGRKQPNTTWLQPPFIVRSRQLPWVVIATHCFYTPPHRLSIYFWRGYIAQSLASKVLSLIRNEAPGFAPHKRERFIWRASKVLLTVSKYLYLLSTLNQRYRFSLVPCPIASVNTAF